MHRYLRAIVLMAAISPTAFADQTVDKSHGFNGIERMYIERGCSASASEVADLSRARTLAPHAASLTCTGDFKEAISVYKQALKTDGLSSTEKGDLYTALGYTAIAADKFRYAKNLLKKAIKFHANAGNDTGMAQAEVWLAKALIMQDHTKKAAGLLEGALPRLNAVPAAEKESVVGNTLLVYAYDKRQEKDKAAEVVRRFAVPGSFTPAEIINIPLYGQNPVFRGRAAQTKGQLRGDVTLTFMVNADGTVIDPEVAASTSSADFERVALNAIQNFRFIPSPDGAEPVRYRFHWDIEDQTGMEVRAPRPPHGTSNFGQVRFGLENVVR